MFQWTRGRRRLQKLAVASLLLAVAILAVPFRQAVALIRGGEGNRPIADPGWPKGAAVIFNNPARIAWWQGPAFGGGQWHAECRGDAKALSAVLTDFARLDVKTKRVIVHDGVGASSWLHLNGEPAKKAEARIDWTFMVWQPANWEHLRKLPADLNPTGAGDADKGAPSHIDVYTGGTLRWSDVIVPEGLEVIDQRLGAHGFTTADGIVLEGKVVDLATKRPLAARMRLQRIEPQPKGGYHYTVVAEAVADAQGRWVLKQAPAGWHRLVLEANGFVPRIVGYAWLDDQPHWQSYDGSLSRPVAVTGRITDHDGHPLADVEVQIRHVVSEVDGSYQSPQEYTVRTGVDGRFRSDQLPVGRATIWLKKSVYCRLGLSKPITLPAKDVELTMIKSARVRVTVDFTGTDRPTEYIVSLQPESGEIVGKWSGSGRIDANNQIEFHDVPPGRYVLQGRPNPFRRDQKTRPMPIGLDGGRTIEVTLPAK
jgi:hypothetical protein